MKKSDRSTLLATFVATAVGAAAWFFGVAKSIWPAHPQLAAFLITVTVGVVVTKLSDADKT